MKKLLILIALLPLLASAQEPLIPKEEMPDLRKFLPPPPDTASAAFQYDKAQYLWGLEQRNDSVRRAIAIGDAEWSVDNICRIMSEPFGLKLSKETTPAIYRMLAVGFVSADQIGVLPKEYYMRTRPYMYFHEPTLAPWDEEELSHNGSYPSGHTILGWTSALLLTELNPDRADTIMARGYMYGQSRVIAGFHWQSDVDAGRLAASVAVLRLHADPRFLKLIDEARKEFEKLSIKH